MKEELDALNVQE